jgi:hypothetical protein
MSVFSCASRVGSFSFEGASMTGPRLVSALRRSGNGIPLLVLGAFEVEDLEFDMFASIENFETDQKMR